MPLNDSNWHPMITVALTSDLHADDAPDWDALVSIAMRICRRHNRDVLIRAVHETTADASPLAALMAAAKACGTHDVNFDTCGVCHKHIVECEDDMSTTDEKPPLTNFFFTCPGARVRAALKKLELDPR